MTKEVLVPLLVPSLIVGGGIKFSGIDGSVLPSAASDEAVLGFRKIAGGNTPVVSSNTPLGSGKLQMSFSDRRIGLMTPSGHGGTSVNAFGTAVLTTIGAAASRYIVPLGNYLARLSRIGFVSTASAGTMAGARITQQSMTMGRSDGSGGFLCSVVFGCSDVATVAGARQFVGITNAANAPTNAEPSAYTSVFGVGHGAADSNLFIYPNAGSVAQPRIDLGPDFPANTLSADAYRVTFSSPSGTDSTINWRVERLGTPHVAEGSYVGTGSTNMFNTHVLSPLWAWRTNNATPLVVGLDIGQVYFEANV